MSEWVKTSERLPELGLVVDTKIDDSDGIRNEQQLKAQGARPLWFFPDGSRYVYYTPTHWRSAK